MSKESSFKKLGNRLNLRDFSLYLNQDGYRLKPDCFYRSKALYRLKKKEIKYFISYHLETILDLRGAAEIESQPDSNIPNVVTKLFPMIPVRIEAISQQKKEKENSHHHKHALKLAPLYGYLVSNEESIKEIKEALQFIFKQEHQGAILWHCSEGKDRAGILSMLFLSALGYSDDVIYDDYLFSNIIGEKKARRIYLKALFSQGSFRLAKGHYDAYIADRSYLENAFLAIYCHYGSVSNFLKEALGIDSNDIEAFKKKYMLKDDSYSR